MGISSIGYGALAGYQNTATPAAGATTDVPNSAAGQFDAVTGSHMYPGSHGQAPAGIHMHQLPKMTQAQQLQHLQQLQQMMHAMQTMQQQQAMDMSGPSYQWQVGAGDNGAVLAAAGLPQTTTTNTTTSNTRRTPQSRSTSQQRRTSVKTDEGLAAGTLPHSASGGIEYRVQLKQQPEPWQVYDANICVLPTLCVYPQPQELINVNVRLQQRHVTLRQLASQPRYQPMPEYPQPGQSLGPFYKALERDDTTEPYPPGPSGWREVHSADVFVSKHGRSPTQFQVQVGCEESQLDLKLNKKTTSKAEGVPSKTVKVEYRLFFEVGPLSNNRILNVVSEPFVIVVKTDYIPAGWRERRMLMLRPTVASRNRQQAAATPAYVPPAGQPPGGAPPGPGALAPSPVSTPASSVALSPSQTPLTMSPAMSPMAMTPVSLPPSTPSTPVTDLVHFDPALSGTTEEWLVLLKERDVRYRISLPYAAVLEAARSVIMEQLNAHLPADHKIWPAFRFWDHGFRAMVPKDQEHRLRVASIAQLAGGLQQITLSQDAANLWDNTETVPLAELEEALFGQLAKLCLAPAPGAPPQPFPAADGEIARNGFRDFFDGVTRTKRLVTLDDFKLFQRFFGTVPACTYRVWDVYKQDYFHGFLPRAEADQLLKESQLGTYLVRYSQQGMQHGLFVLNVHKLNRRTNQMDVGSYQISFDGSKYIFGNKDVGPEQQRYSSLLQLVQDKKYSDRLARGLTRHRVQSTEEAAEQYQDGNELTTLSLATERLSVKDSPR